MQEWTRTQQQGRDTTRQGWIRGGKQGQKSPLTQESERRGIITTTTTAYHHRHHTSMKETGKNAKKIGHSHTHYDIFTVHIRISGLFFHCLLCLSIYLSRRVPELVFFSPSSNYGLNLRVIELFEYEYEYDRENNIDYYYCYYPYWSYAVSALVTLFIFFWDFGFWGDSGFRMDWIGLEVVS